jgi:hypothetical protein
MTQPLSTGEGESEGAGEKIRVLMSNHIYLIIIEDQTEGRRDEEDTAGK